MHHQIRHSNEICFLKNSKATSTAKNKHNNQFCWLSTHYISGTILEDFYTLSYFFLIKMSRTKTKSICKYCLCSRLCSHPDTITPKPCHCPISILRLELFPDAEIFVPEFFYSGVSLGCFPHLNLASLECLPLLYNTSLKNCVL